MEMTDIILAEPSEDVSTLFNSSPTTGVSAYLKSNIRAHAKQVEADYENLRMEKY
jgi:hypothetical protein